MKNYIKNSYELNFVKDIHNSFKKYLEEKISNEKNIETILKKGNHIISEMDNKNKEDKKALIVGHVQSGKTMNFLSVINSSLDYKYKIIVILTSYEKELHKQTVTRLENAFDINENKNYLKIVDWTDGKISSLDLKNNVECDYITIITLLKNKVNEVKDILDVPYFSDKKILIIDDEGDLGSMTQFKDDYSKTYKSIENLLKVANPLYLSVTATPQVHIVTSEMKSLFPKRVFCIDPGDGYVGLEYFMDPKNFERTFVYTDNSINDKDWLQTDIFHESLLYFLTVEAFLIQESIMNYRSNMNMLVHTNLRTSEHDKYSKAISELIEHYKELILVKSYDTEKFKNDIENIVEKYNLNFDINDDFFEKLQFILKNTVCSEINQKNKNNKINDYLSSILVGSRKLERGITLDNLIVTFFTNRAKHTSTIDTLLQRARWFGYRTKVLKYMKIFTTKQIADDFKNIVIHNRDLWELLKNADENSIPFDLIDTTLPLLIESTSNNKLKITNKAPYKRLGISRRTMMTDVYFLEENKLLFNKILNVISLSNDELNVSSSNNFQNKWFKNTSELFEYLNEDDFRKLFGMDENIFNLLTKEIDKKGYKTNASILDVGNGNYRTRNCRRSSSGIYHIEQIFQGRSDNDRSDKYIGDAYWNNIEGYKNVVFLQIHKVKPLYQKENVLKNNEFIYVPVLILPEDLSIKNILSDLIDDYQ